jgi:hypothetical protein
MQLLKSVFAKAPRHGLSETLEAIEPLMSCLEATDVEIADLFVKMVEQGR